MNMLKLEEAIGEASRFLEKARELQERGLGLRGRPPIGGVFTGCKESGATRRASMDLSNALADLRKTN